MENQTAQVNYVELKLTSKGFYHWNIKTLFDSSDSEDQIAEKLKNIDAKLRDRFAKNVSELLVTKTKFSEVEDLD